MKKTALGIALAISTLFTTSAIAQNGKAAKASAPKAKAAKPKVQNMNMEPMEMEGGIGSPDGIPFNVRPGAKQPPFKFERTSFYREIVRSSERF